jgi:hypothetical protein
LLTASLLAENATGVDALLSGGIMFLPHVHHSAIESAMTPDSIQSNLIAARLPDQLRMTVNQ